MEKKPKINYNLEALRGFAALFVVFHHLSIWHADFDSFYVPKFIGAIEPNGHLSVLVFFLLSGYVIGISNKKPLALKTIPAYLKKRFVRIYPIYIIAIIATLLIAKNGYPVFTVVGNFFFLQPWFVDVLPENNPVWSLDYEVCYYLLFIAISYLDLNPVVVLFTSLVIAMVNLLCFYDLNLPAVSSYLFGFVFWMFGLCVARVYKQERKINFQLLMSNIFLLLSTSYIKLFSNGFYQLMTRIFKRPIFYPSTTYWAKGMIGFIDLAYLPYCAYFILNFTSKEYKSRKYISFFLQIFPIILFPFLIKKSIKDHTLDTAIVSSLFYLLSLLLFVVRTKQLEALSKWIIGHGINLGGISYGLYIIHLPLIYLFGRLHFFDHTGFDYAIRLVVYLTFTLSISFLLERRYQLMANEFLTNRINFIKSKIPAFSR